MARTGEYTITFYDDLHLKMCHVACKRARNIALNDLFAIFKS